MDEEVQRKMVESYGFMFLLSQRFEYITDALLRKDGLTTKQLLALIVIEKSFDHMPSISEVAEALSTSHQNVKQIALQLEKKGFVKITRDPNDRRRRLLSTTDYSRHFFDSREAEHASNIVSLFGSLTDAEIHSLHSIIVKLLANTDDFYREIRGIK